MSNSQQDSSYQSLSGTSQPVLFFRPAGIDDLHCVHQLEESSYPADEAATREKLEYRLNHASNVFLVAVQTGCVDGQDVSGSEQGVQPVDRVVGFTCGTCANGEKLTHESMSHHEPEGTLLCIHSVVVAHDLRRKGIATKMLKAYLSFVQASAPNVTSVRLLCKDDLVLLYQGAGFELIGPSDVVHGQDQWYEMKHDLEQ